jgi:hypothetical protein
VNKSLQGSKNKKTIEYLGCDIEEFKKHIEEQFMEGMTWENHGDVWHVDHMIPLRFENPTLEQVIERLHYTNCQPLWIKDNLEKRNRYISIRLVK